MRGKSPNGVDGGQRSEKITAQTNESKTQRLIVYSLKEQKNKQHKVGIKTKEKNRGGQGEDPQPHD